MVKVSTAGARTGHHHEDDAEAVESRRCARVDGAAFRILWCGWGHRRADSLYI